MHEEAFPIERPALYVVATPIGNLGDLSPRALATLRQVDCVAAEDTRVTGQLFKRLGIQARLINLREHNEREAAARLIERLDAGEAVAQVSDAGTPAVSDPGARLVQSAHEAGYRVIPIPGASAVLAALAASGITDTRFTFFGFLEAKSGARRKQLANLANWPHTLVFFEAPHRIAESLADCAAVLGEARRATFARELTKTFETIRHAPLGALRDWVAADANQQRGEIVLAVAAAAVEADAASDPGAHDALLKPLLAALPLSQAVQIATEISGASRKQLYDRALALRG
jgi:16S rRNA (cytidine1402-2'-O)-methyltransferase